MLRLTGPDHAVYLYADLREQMIAPQAWSPEAIRGELHEKSCFACGDTRWHRTRSKREGERTLCRGCGKPWIIYDASTPKWKQRKRYRSRNEPVEQRMTDLSTLHVLIFGKPRDFTTDWWEFDLYCYIGVLLRTDGLLDELGVAGARAVALVGAKEWPDSPRPWTERTVQRAKREAQDIIGTRIERAKARGEIR